MPPIDPKCLFPSIEQRLALVIHRPRLLLQPILYSSSLPISDVTILLSLTVFLNTVSESMPATSDAVPLISKEVLQGIQSPDSFPLVNLALHTLTRETRRFGDSCRPSRALVFSFGVLTRNYVCVKGGELRFFFSRSFPNEICTVSIKITLFTLSC